MKNLCKFSMLAIVLLGLSGVALADDVCGPGNWVDTGVKGPFGWTWHYNADATNISGAATLQNVAALCGYFYNSYPKESVTCSFTTNIKGNTYGVQNCSYNTGAYNLNNVVLNNGAGNLNTVCQVC